MICHNLEINVNENKASLQVMLWEESPELKLCDRPLILICPGGGYEMVSDREADTVSTQFLAMGYHTAILRYTVAPARYPTALLQLAGAMKMIRDNAGAWHVNTDKIIVMGFSAGGHLAASLGVFWKKELLQDYYHCQSGCFRPNGMILCYPVITSGEFAHRGSFHALLAEREDELSEEMSLEKQVSSDVPPTFLWHTDEDDCVPVENSLMFYAALHRAGVPAEYHVFQKGGHGLGVASELSETRDGYGIQKECQCWTALAHAWVKSNF